MGKYYIFDFLKEDYPVSQEYGVNAAYYQQFGLTAHEGVDFKTPNGTDIFSPLTGVIVRDGFSAKDYGNYVVVYDPIQHCAVWFCHLLDNVVAIGDKVQAGQLLGRTNNTGNTTGPHCHVNFCETDENGIRINMNNSYQGFLNILNPELVTWKLFPDTEPPVAQPQAPQQESQVLSIIPGTAYRQDQLPATLFNVSDQSMVTYAGTKYIVRVNLDGTRTFIVPQPETVQTATNTQPQDTSLTMEKQRDDALAKVKEIGDNYNTDLSNYKALIAAGYSTVDDVSKSLKNVADENTGLKKQITEVLKRNETYHVDMAAKEKEDYTAIERGMNYEAKYKDLCTEFTTIAKAFETKPSMYSILQVADRLKRSYEDIVKHLQKKETTDSVKLAIKSVDEVLEQPKKQNSILRLLSFK